MYIILHGLLKMWWEWARLLAFISGSHLPVVPLLFLIVAINDGSGEKVTFSLFSSSVPLSSRSTETAKRGWRLSFVAVPATPDSGGSDAKACALLVATKHARIESKASTVPLFRREGVAIAELCHCERFACSSCVLAFVLPV